MAKVAAVPPRWKWLARLVGDSGIVILIAIVTNIFRKVVVPVYQGFQCHDPRLQQPAKTEVTVSNGILYGVGFGLPAAVMIVTECFLVFKEERFNSDQNRKRTWWLLMVQKSFEAIVPFFFGGAVTHLTTNVPKYAIGRLRPNFFDICQPDWSRVDCSNGGYIMDDICTEPNINVIEKARVAFPSGHASLSMYFMLFLILYLQRRWTWSGWPLLRPLTQLLLFYMALYCGLSRLRDHLHHWEDILAGDIMGAAIAVGVAMKVRPVYTPLEKKEEAPDTLKEDLEVTEDPLEGEAATVKVDVEDTEQKE